MRRHRYWIVSLLLGLLIISIAGCGDEGDDPEKTQTESEQTPRELAEERAPRAVETADELLTALRDGDRAAIEELCFRDIDTVADELGLSAEEIEESRLEQQAQLAAFEAFWNDMILSGAYSLDSWSEPTAAEIAPAEGHPELIVYLTISDLEYTLNGEGLTTEELVIPVFNLGEHWYCQWPF